MCSFAKAIQEIKEDGVVLACEASDDIEVTWKKGGEVKQVLKNPIYEVKAEQGTVIGLYSCEYSDPETDPKEKITHMFYLKIKGEETSLLFM